MQTGLPATINIMKTLQLSLSLLFLPLIFHAQSLTGLWMGKLSNDSNTVRKDDEYEIVLTEYKNKVYGYTRSTFFVDDNLYYIVKKVEGVINGNICEVSDAGVIMHNFPQKPEKKVKVAYTFRRSPADSTWSLDGEWKTNTTKKYYSISGKSDLSQERDLSKAKIFPHLEELNETKDIAVYNEWKKEKEAAIASNDNSFRQEFLKSLIVAEKEKNNIVSATKKPEVAVNTYNKTAQPMIEIIPEEKKTDVALEKQVVGDSKTPVSREPIQIITSNKTSAEMAEIKVEEKKSDVSLDKQIADEKKTTLSNPVQLNTSNKTSAESVVVKTEPKKTAISPEKQTAEAVQYNPQTGYIEEKTTRAPASIVKTNNTINTNQPQSQPVALQDIKQEQKSEPGIKINTPVLNSDAAKAVAEREFDKPQEINFTSDSLVLALYDNGEVDGDTVSVLLNGEVIVAKQCLKTVAFKKTIYIPAGDFQANIVLYAENLGVYPPNTGLLVLIDGEERHNIRFSADYKKNSAIVLKRKKQ
jgi:hypothetical protein